MIWFIFQPSYHTTHNSKMTRNRISPSAKMGLFFKFTFWLLPHGLLNMAKAAVRAWLEGLPIGPSLWNSFARPLMANITPKEIHAILPSTIDTYREWTAAAGYEYNVKVLADNETRLLWLAQRKVKRVLLFFHGGGYVMPLSPGHLDWMAYVNDETGKAGVELDLCVLEYDLIPDAHYPHQMIQAIISLKHLLASGYAPNNIIFGGDSAGGHLALSLLSHLHHARPNDPGLNCDMMPMDSLKGCFLVSPLASFSSTTASYKRRCSVDVLGKDVVDSWGKLLIRNSPWHDEISKGYAWGMALDAPNTWWEELDSVKNILVTGGEEEVFRDHVVQLLDVLKRKTKTHVTGYMAEKEAHDGPLMDFSAKRPPGPTTKFITEWIIARLKE